MTPIELMQKFNDEYGIKMSWPQTYEVDAETYANCCQFVFEQLMELNPVVEYSWGLNCIISLGHNKGLMFKGVELILK